MRITNWPQEDRPREKLLIKGESALTDAELIAILLKSGTRGKTALDLARELLIEYGSIKKLMLAPPPSLMHKPGLGSAKYTSLKAAIELGRRYLGEPMQVGATLNNSRATQQFLAERLREYTSEVFACLFMDNHFRLINYEELFYGTINETSIYPREIIRRALLQNAAKVILAHNHPSGCPVPSQADRQVTTLVRESLHLVDIAVVDHVIIGNPDNFSFAEAGMIP